MKQINNYIFEKVLINKHTNLRIYVLVIGTGTKNEFKYETFNSKEEVNEFISKNSSDWRFCFRIWKHNYQEFLRHFKVIWRQEDSLQEFKEKWEAFDTWLKKVDGKRYNNGDR